MLATNLPVAPSFAYMLGSTFNEVVKSFWGPVIFYQGTQLQAQLTDDNIPLHFMKQMQVKLAAHGGCSRFLIL